MRTKKLLAGVCALCLHGMSAGATSYTLYPQRVYGAVNGPLLFGPATLTMADWAAASGSMHFTEMGRVSNGLPYSDPNTGFISFTGADGLVLANPDLMPYTSLSTTIALSLDSQGDITSGTININNSNTEYMLTLLNGTFSGIYGTDGPSGCTGAPCTVEGIYSTPLSTPMAVPEPSAAALLLAGISVIALSCIGSRRRVAAEFNFDGTGQEHE